MIGIIIGNIIVSIITVALLMYGCIRVKNRRIEVQDKTTEVQDKTTEGYYRETNEKKYEDDTNDDMYDIYMRMMNQNNIY